jgi:hypothetical protein
VAEPDIWLRANHNVYEYIGVYVDDLAIVAKDPQSIVDELTNHYEFKLKGTGPMTFHLGCDYTRDEHGVLCISPTKYIHKVIDAYKQMFECSLSDFPKPRVTLVSEAPSRRVGLASPEVTSAPADGKGPFLSKVNPTRLAKRAIVLNQPDGGAIVSPKPVVHDVLFNPTSEGREQVGQHNRWGEQQQHCEPHVCDFMKDIHGDPEEIHGGPWKDIHGGPEDIHGDPWVSGLLWTPKEFRSVSESKQ